MDVMYEVANLGLSFGTALTRSGIFRVTESFVMEALTRPNVNARFVATDSYVSEVQLARYDRSVNGRLGERRVTAWDSGASSFEESMSLVDRLLAADEGDPATARLRAEVALLNRMARPRSIAGPVTIYHSIRQPLASRDRVPARVRIATIHDMIPSLFPEITEDRFVAFHQAVLRSIDVERDWVMCISESHQARLHQRHRDGRASASSWYRSPRRRRSSGRRKTTSVSSRYSRDTASPTGATC